MASTEISLVTTESRDHMQVQRRLGNVCLLLGALNPAKTQGFLTKASR